jgi:hypothetical protein
MRRTRKKLNGDTVTTLPILPSLATPPLAQREAGKVMKAEWRDPEGLNPNARLTREVKGWRGYDPLRKCLERHGSASSITEKHVIAADQLRLLADGACVGFSPPRDTGLPVHSIQYRPLTGPGQAALRQARCWHRFVKVMANFTRSQRELLTEVVLMNRPVSRVAEERGRTPAHLMGHLEAILDQLVGYFADEVDRAIGRAQAAA